MGKIVQRKDSKIQWEIWLEDDETIKLMNYSGSKPRGLTVKRDIFEKHWKYINQKEKL